MVLGAQLGVSDDEVNRETLVSAMSPIRLRSHHELLIDTHLLRGRRFGRDGASCVYLREDDLSVLLGKLAD